MASRRSKATRQANTASFSWIARCRKWTGSRPPPRSAGAKSARVDERRLSRSPPARSKAIESNASPPHGRLFAQTLHRDPDAVGAGKLATPCDTNGLNMLTRWLEILSMAGGVASIVALFVFAPARNRRPEGLHRDPRAPQRAERPDRQAAYYRASGAL